MILGTESFAVTKSQHGKRSFVIFSCWKFDFINLFDNKCLYPLSQRGVTTVSLESNYSQLSFDLVVGIWKYFETVLKNNWS